MGVAEAFFRGRGRGFRSRNWLQATASLAQAAILDAPLTFDIPLVGEDASTVGR